MRQAINNLQATYVGFQYISKENILKVCDVPNLDILNQAVGTALSGDFIKVQSKRRLKFCLKTFGMMAITPMTSLTIFQKYFRTINLQLMS